MSHSYNVVKLETHSVLFELKRLASSELSLMPSEYCVTTKVKGQVL